MMTMTELFYGPIEPTWLVHPQYRQGPKRQNNNNNNKQSTTIANPYLIYSDEYRRHPSMQPNVGPYTSMMVPPHDGNAAAMMRGGPAYPYQAHYFVQGNGEGIQGLKQAQSPARNGVLQPRNVGNAQTLHFMVPLCCEKCEVKVKDQLLDLDDVQRVTCDQWKQKVSVTTTIAPEKLLARLQKLKKRSTFWPQQVRGAVKVFNGNHVINQHHHQDANNKNHHNQHHNENEIILNDENDVGVQEDLSVVD